MKTKISLAAFLVSVLVTGSISAQPFEIRGKITESESGENMVGVHITINEDVHGTISGSDGNFALKTTRKPPVVIHVSFVGFVPMDIEVTNLSEPLDIRMEEQYLLGQEVVISASRVEEKILQSSVSIEKLNTRDLRMISAANFYDGLYQLKGVDMNVHGLTFSLPNTRGFNDYTNYRMNQIIDIMESFEKRGERTIEIEKIVSEAESKGLERRQAEDIIEKLKKEAQIFEPKRGFVQRV